MSNARTERRLEAARRALDQALDDVSRAVARVDRHRARIRRLLRVLATPADIRRERARRGLETRERRRGLRQVTLRED